MTVRQRWVRIGAAVIGLVMLVAALGKAFDPIALYPSLGALFGASVSPEVGIWVVGVLAVGEMLLGCLLLAWRWPRATAATSVIVLLAFSLATVLLVIDPTAPPCGCLGAATPKLLSENARFSNQIALARNLLLLVVACWITLAAFRAERLESGHTAAAQASPQ